MLLELVDTVVDMRQLHAILLFKVALHVFLKHLLLYHTLSFYLAALKLLFKCGKFFEFQLKVCKLGLNLLCSCRLVRIGSLLLVVFFQ